MAAWVRRRDTRGVFEIVPYQAAPSPPMNDALRAACERAVHVVDPDNTTSRAGRACLLILGELGWPRLSAFLALPPMVWAVELAYRLVAANRPFFARFMFRREDQGGTARARRGAEPRFGAPDPAPPRKNPQ